MEGEKPLYKRIAGEIRGEPTPLKDIYPRFPEHAEETIRARIYEYLGEVFERLDRGIYVTKVGNSDVAVVKGDAWEEIKALKSDAFDTIITDFAYPWMKHHVETGTTRKSGGKTYETKDLDEDILSEFYRVLKTGAHCFLFVPSLNRDTLSPLYGFIERVEDTGFTFHKFFVWDEQVIGMGYTGRARYQGILFFSKGKKRQPVDRSVPDLLSYKRIPSSKRRHEDEKPVPLLKELVKFSTEEGEWVLDPFAGSGSTGVACAELDRNCVLIEIEEKFVEDVIVPNIAEEGPRGQKTLQEW